MLGHRFQALQDGTFWIFRKLADLKHEMRIGTVFSIETNY